jgi:hypothetical protein
MWGFTDKYTWRGTSNHPLIFDENYDPKPAYYAIQDRLDDPPATATPTPDPNALTLQAEDYDAMQGINNHGTGISYVDDGDWIRFDNVDLGSGYTTLRVRYARDGSNTGDRWAELRLGSTTGTEIARFYSDGTGGWSTYIEDTTSVAGGSGVQTLYFVFRGGIAVGNFDWFRFEDGGGPTPTPTPTDTPTPTNTPVPTNTPTPTPTPSGELLTNPGFEQDTTDWSNFGGTSISAQSTYAHSGGQAVLVSNRNATWDGVQQDVTSPVQANGQGSYTLAAWFRLASGTYTAKVTVRLVADSTTYKGVTCTANSTGWTECSGSTDLTWSGTLKSATFYLEIPGSSSVDFYGDDASLQKD